VFTVPLSTNDHLDLFHYSDFQLSCYNIYTLKYAAIITPPLWSSG
jgi:hypothetical protein